MCDPLFRRSGSRRILLDVENTVTAGYLEEFREVFASDARLRFFKLTKSRVTPEDRACIAAVRCPHISYRIACALPWDLLVMADHRRHVLSDCGRFPLLRISHGIGSKMVNGEDYFYGRGAYDSTGRHVRYARIFEASALRRAEFVAKQPELDPVVRVVGDLRLDRLLRRAATASQFRERPLLVIASSWSAGNLLENAGPGLFDELLRLNRSFTTVLRPHPHFFRADAPARWSMLLTRAKEAGITVSPPSEDLGELLASASVVVSDDLTSVALYAVVLDRRLVLWPSGSDQIPAGSFLGRLNGLVPCVERADQLAEQVTAALAREPAPAVRRMAGEIDSHPHQAARLVRTEVYQLLDLPPNPSQTHSEEIAVPALTPQGGRTMAQPEKP